MLQFVLITLTDPIRGVGITQSTKRHYEHVCDTIKLTVRCMVKFLPQVTSRRRTEDQIVEKDNSPTDSTNGPISQPMVTKTKKHTVSEGDAISSTSSSRNGVVRCVR